MAHAAIIQARLFNNPLLTYENVLYNGTTHRFFDYTDHNGEFMVQIQQMIRTAGKRSKLIRLAELNKELETLAFEDLLRVLKFQIHSDYATIFSILRRLNLQRLEEAKLIQLVEISRNQLLAGIISAYELTRIEYELTNLQSSIRDQLQDLANVQAELRLFLRIEGAKFIVPVNLSLEESPNVSYQVILDSALMNRPDYKLTKTGFNYQEENLAYQKALAYPDLTVGSDFDRYGSAFPNYFGVNVNVGLPIFNRNQGNIKIAGLQADLANKNISYTAQQVTQDVTAAYDQLAYSSKLFKKITPGYEHNFQTIINEAIKSYQERVIGLLDFMDKIRTFENGQLNIIDTELNYFLSKLNVNFVSNTEIYK
jgi:cobalt-zinc-cadmium efflux system outer membrane protein